MKHLGCSYGELLELPADYIEVVLEEAKREQREAKQRRNNITRS
jgi:hypothetical protein